MEAQRTADTTGIPRLSAAAEAAVGAMAGPTDEKVRAEAWRVMQQDKVGVVGWDWFAGYHCLWPLVEALRR